MRGHRLACALTLCVLAGSGISALAVQRTDEPLPGAELRGLAGLRWIAELPAAAQIAHTSGDRLYVLTAEGQILGMDLVNGDVLWRRPGPEHTALLLVREGQVLAAGDNELYCLDAASGDLRWAQVWSGADAAGDALGVDALGDGWLVRSLGQRRFAQRLTSRGSTLWDAGPAAGGYWLGHGMLFALQEDGVLAGHGLGTGEVSWSARLEAGRYRLEPDGSLTDVKSGRRQLEIAAGPSLRAAAPLRGAKPGSPRPGPVQCEAGGCRVELPGGWRWFEGYVQMLPEELRVIRGVGQPEACIGCLGQAQPEVLQIESWSKDGASAWRKAYVRRLDVHEDERGFIELAGSRVVASGWMAP